MDSRTCGLARLRPFFSVPLAGYRLEAHGEAARVDRLGAAVARRDSGGRWRAGCPGAIRHSIAATRGCSGPLSNLRTPQQALRFAKRYGLLERPPRSLTRPGGALRGEPLGLWQTHVRRLLALETLAEFIEQNDRDALSEIVIWGDDPLGVSIYPGIALRRAVEEERLPAPLLEVRSGLAAGLVPFRRYTDLTNQRCSGRRTGVPGGGQATCWSLRGCMSATLSTGPCAEACTRK